MSFFIVAPPGWELVTYLVEYHAGEDLPALAREPIVAHRVLLREFHDRGLATLTPGAGREDDGGATP
jgi:hypothetical protein